MDFTFQDCDVPSETNSPWMRHKTELGFCRKSRAESFPLYCKQDIFIFYIQWLIFLLIGNTMKNTMLRKGLTIF